MAETKFKVFFGDRPATAEELARIEEIVIEQEIDSIWEARLTMYLCLDKDGRWRGQAHEVAQPFSRVRIELQTGGKPFEPLIDGAVASYENSMDSQPGRSTTTLVVRDDGVLLNREDRQARYDDKTDVQIVREVLSRHTDVLDGSPEIRTPDGDSARDAFQRTSDLVFLKQIAKVYDFHAYVLPTRVKGKSKFYFRPKPETVSTDHPELVLLGAGRNLGSATITDDCEGPERTRHRTLRFDDGSVVAGNTSFGDVQLMRDLPAVPEDVSAIRNVPPADAVRTDATAVAAGQQGRHATSIKLSAKVVPCYGAVLRPYIKLPVRAANTPYGGPWVIRKVIHRITPSVYAQEMEAVTDSRSQTAAPSRSPSIF